MTKEISSLLAASACAGAGPPRRSPGFVPVGPGPGEATANTCLVGVGTGAKHRQEDRAERAGLPGPGKMSWRSPSLAHSSTHSASIAEHLLWLGQCSEPGDREGMVPEFQGLPILSGCLVKATVSTDQRQLAWDRTLALPLTSGVILSKSLHSLCLTFPTCNRGLIKMAHAL